MDPSLNNVFMPAQIRDVLKDTTLQSGERTEKIRAYMRDDTISKAYFAWAAQNIILIQERPELRQLHLTAMNLSTPEEAASSRFPLKKIAKAVQKTFTRTDYFEETKKQLVFLHAGLITAEECAANPIVRSALLNRECYEKVVPLLYAIDAKDLAPFFQVIDSNGCAVLHCPPKVRIALPLLKAKFTLENSSLFMEMLSKQHYTTSECSPLTVNSVLKLLTENFTDIFLKEKQAFLKNLIYETDEPAALRITKDTFKLLYQQDAYKEIFMCLSPADIRNFLRKDWNSSDPEIASIAAELLRGRPAQEIEAIFKDTSVNNFFLPAPISEVIKDTTLQPAERTDKIRALMRDNAIREAYFAWAAQNVVLIQERPELRQIHLAAMNLSDPENAPSSRFELKNIAKAAQKAFTAIDHFEEAKKQLIYFHAGLITVQECVANRHVKFAFLDGESFQKMQPFLYAIDAKDLVVFLHIAHNQGYSNTHNASKVKVALPLLKAKFTLENSSLFMEMLSKTPYRSVGSPLRLDVILELLAIDFKDIFLKEKETFVQILFKTNFPYIATERFKLLYAHDEYKEIFKCLSPLDIRSFLNRHGMAENLEVINIAAELMRQKSDQEIKRFLVSYDKVWMYKFLKAPGTLKAFTPLLERLDSSELLELFKVGSSLDDFLKDADSADIICKVFLAKLSPVELCSFIEKNNRFEGYGALFKSPHLNDEQKIALLKHTGIPFLYAGITATCLVYPSIFEDALPLLNRLPVQQLYEVLQTQPYLIRAKNLSYLTSQKVAQYPNYFALHLPIFKRLSSEQLFNILPKNDLALLNTLLSHTVPPDDIAEAISLLESREFVEILSPSNANPNNLRMICIPGIFPRILYRLQQAVDSGDDIVRIFERKGDDVSALSRQDDEFKVVILPWLQSLPKWQRKAILASSNEQGETYLHNTQTAQTALELMHDFTAEERNFFISSPDARGRRPYVVNPTVLKQALPSTFKAQPHNEFFVRLMSSSKQDLSEIQEKLAQLSVEDLVALCSARDKDGKTLLHNSKMFKILLPYLIKIPFEQRKSILSNASEYAAMNVFKVEDIYALAEGDIQQLKQLLEVRDLHGRTYLDYPKNFISLLSSPNIKKLDETSLRTLFPSDTLKKFQNMLKASYMTKESEEFCAKPNIALFAAAVPLFKIMSQDEIRSIFGMTHNSQIRSGASPLHYDQIAEVCMPLLMHLHENGQNEFLVELLLKTDQWQQTPLYTASFSILTPLFEKLPRELFMKLVTHRDDHGETCFHHPLLFNLSIPMLMNFDVEVLEAILDLKAPDGRSPIHMKPKNPDQTPYLFEGRSLVLLNRLEPEKFRAYLEAKDKTGQTPTEGQNPPFPNLEDLKLLSFAKQRDLLFMPAGKDKDTIFMLMLCHVQIDVQMLLLLGIEDLSLEEIRACSRLEDGSIDPTALRNAVVKKSEEQTDPIKKVKSLFLRHLVGDTSFILQYGTTVSYQVLFGDRFVDVRALGEQEYIRSCQLQTEYMNKTVCAVQVVPEAIDMNAVNFSVKEGQPYVNNYDFIPDMISSSFVLGHINVETRDKLLNMANKIKNNYDYFSNRNTAEVRASHDNFCAYLSHVAVAYKLGQVEGDDDRKTEVLKVLAEMQQNCNPRWDDEIKQLYFYRPAGTPTVVDAAARVYSVEERLYTHLRNLRVDIISNQLPEENKQFVHERHFLLDLLREDLHTYLSIINDPVDWYKTDSKYPRKPHFIAKFDLFYTKEVIVQFFKDYAEQQAAQRIGKHEKNPIDIPGEELADFLLTSFLAETSDDTCNRIAQEVMSLPDDDSRKELLGYYGISWNLGDTVKKTITEISNRVELIDKMLKRTGINSELAGFERENLGMDEIEGFFMRYGIKADAKEVMQQIEAMPANSDIESLKAPLKAKVDEWRQGLRKEQTELLQLKGKVDNAPEEEKAAILQEAGKMKEPQPLHDVLKRDNIRLSIAKRRLHEEAFDPEGKLTPFGAAYLLTSTKVVAPNKITAK